jgi:hypothetical protein
MLYFAVARGEPSAHFLRIVVEWAHAAAIGDAAGFVDDVEAFGPGGVGVIGGIGHVVDAEGKRKIEALRKIVADGEALLQRRGLGVADVLFDVGLHLPFVGGMRFADIDRQKIGVVFVIVEDLDDVTDLATKGRSSKAAENENERFAGGAFANVETVGAVQREETGIGRGVADFQVAAMHVRERVADHVERVPGAARHNAECNEGDDDERADADANPHGNFPHERKLPKANLVREINSGLKDET